MVSDERTLDLLKLFLVVRDKGGYDVVSRRNLWDLVAEESGLGSIISSDVKVLYVEYLNVFERWLEKVVEDRDSRNRCSSSGDGTSFEFNGLSDCNDTIAVLKTEDKNIASCGETLCQLDKRAWDIYDAYDLYEDEGTSLELSSNVDENSDDIHIDQPLGLNIRKYENVSVDVVDNHVELSSESIHGDDYDPDNKEAMILDSTSVEEHNFSHERKCDSMLEMFIWITEVAKNPCNPVIGLLPEISKWKSRGNEEIWMQALLIRGARLLRGHIDTYAEQSALQNKRSYMFDDHQGSGYHLRERIKSRKIFPSGTSSGRSLILGAEDQLDQEILATDSWMPDYMRNSASNKIPLGPKFQVEVPAWSGIASESHSKWFGTRVWPLDKENEASLLKHNFIGKGREDSCKCRMRGSTNCIMFHILKKKYKVKLEIGSAFYQWKFDRMGEEVRLRWTKKQEHKFKRAVNSSSASFKQSFRTRVSEYFPYKTREDIVCYYFNVFLLHRRRYQNRFCPDKICSDDELEV